MEGKGNRGDKGVQILGIRITEKWKARGTSKR